MGRNRYILLLAALFFWGACVSIPHPPENKVPSESNTTTEAPTDEDSENPAPEESDTNQPTETEENTSSSGPTEEDLLELSLEDEKKLALCEEDADCIVVDYAHCCGATKKAINRNYLDEYNKYPEWQKFDDSEVCAVVGVCPDDSAVTAAKCNLIDEGEMRECQLVFPEKISGSPPEEEEEEEEEEVAPISDLQGTLEIFEDYQCPFCKRFEQETIALLQEKHPRVEILFSHFPLQIHPDARPAARFAICAGVQGKFTEMSSLLFRTNDLGTDNLYSLADTIALNREELDACLKSPQTEEKIDADIKRGRSLGVQGTPTFFIDGQKYEGFYPVENVEKFLREGQ